MKAVTFLREFHFRTGPAETRVFPKGWRGAVSDEIAAAARKSGAIEAPKRRNAKTAKQDAQNAAGDDGGAG